MQLFWSLMTIQMFDDWQFPVWKPWAIACSERMGDGRPLILYEAMLRSIWFLSTSRCRRSMA